MDKPRLLIPVTIQFCVRYAFRTGLLEKIKDYAYPIVVLGWQDPDLVEELENMGMEVHQNPGKRMGVQYSRTRNKIDLWHFDHMGSSSTQIDRFRNRLLGIQSSNLRRIVRDAYFRVRMSDDDLVNNAIIDESKLLYKDTNLSQYEELVHRIKPEAVFSITPYFIEEELILRAAKEQGIPICASILSFDNITTKGWMPLTFDRYCLWNRYNQEELYRIYPQTKEKKVDIVGAPQFDFYYDNSYIWDELDWRKELGIPTNRPVILFGSTGRVIAPHEGLWLRHLDEAIDRGEIRENPVVLLRRHPNDPIEYWKPFKQVCKNVIFDEPWKAGREIPGKTNITRWDIERLTSTLSHSSVHVNASSTMTVDGAIFDRPQIGPAYDENKKFDRVARELYQREHYLPITRSGGLDIVYSRNELIQAVNNVILNPEHRKNDRQRLVEEICTFTDGKCTDRVNTALRDFLLEGNKQ